MSPPLLIAHRGASVDAVENSLRAFELARDQRADAVECDIQLSRDGVPVVFHDRTLERLIGDTRPVGSVDIGGLRTLRLDDGEVIPTLREALEWSMDGLPLVIELKSGRSPVSLVTAVAGDLAAVGGRLLWISSFSSEILQAVAELLPALPRALVSTAPYEQAIEAARAEGASALHLGQSAWRPGTSALPVLVWTIDDPRQALRVVEEGAAGIFTNRPGLLSGLREAA
ncbi:MAG: glycerophosphodiester phosphodiesterase [Thermomicrobiales bacterium]|nr:glycerophosphodiester phosphodiesterase [Thermomicrobiales bacterium]